MVYVDANTPGTHARTKCIHKPCYVREELIIIWLAKLGYVSTGAGFKLKEASSSVFSRSWGRYVKTHTFYTSFISAHLLRSAYSHVHTWLSNNVRSLFLNYNVSFYTSCLVELTPPTDHLDDVQAWRNDDDWQIISNTWPWLDKRIQGPQNISIIQSKSADSWWQQYTHGHGWGEGLTPPTLTDQSWYYFTPRCSELLVRGIARTLPMFSDLP